MHEESDHRHPDPPPKWVVCLCADWCGVCRDYRAVFDAAADAFPELLFVWVDIEDEAELLGDFDVEAFPTVVIFDEEGPGFVGPVTPQQTALHRLIKAGVTDAAQAAFNSASLEPLMARLRSEGRRAASGWA